MLHHYREWYFLHRNTKRKIFQISGCSLLYWRTLTLDTVEQFFAIKNLKKKFFRQMTSTECFLFNCDWFQLLFVFNWPERKKNWKLMLKALLKLNLLPTRSRFFFLTNSIAETITTKHKLRQIYYNRNCSTLNI